LFFAATYLVIWGIEILRDGIAALGIHAVVGPFRDGDGRVCHGEAFDYRAILLLPEDPLG
jgi:hypothetical protein